ncbi:dTDP-4-dehydrorhamnose 3,5-epimerase [Candidatus Marinamargulisbacteria bacterium SCGC AG-414-C22]|nr:dTDP-4-dehydrorhamnose 3,5-epimerase [Candidatus Marinamargulisbacteria bacterium SCGC AG-414-C22]
MIFTKTELPGVIICEPKVYGDTRGYFFESFRKDRLDEYLGYSIQFSQDNESKSGKGVLRGLHYQLAPFAQTKLVRVIQGSVLDVAVDIRRGSPTFGQHVNVKLSAENKKQLLVPRGFAHGFIVLEENTIFSYKVDNIYSSESERAIAFDDPKLDIDWKFSKENITLSNKDLNAPKLDQVQELFEFEIDYYN